ncbi:MAG: sigma 54-interacting transcriptional regulator [Alphaproteobacteria bacterium]
MMPAVCVYHVRGPRHATAYRGRLEEAGLTVSTVADFAKAKEAIERAAPLACLVELGDEVSAEDEALVASLAALDLKMRCLALVSGAALEAPALASLARRGLVQEIFLAPEEVEQLAPALGRLARHERIERPGAAGADASQVSAGGAYFLGSSAAMLGVFSIIRKYAEVDAPVLITGETGTGKELAAQAVHERSRYRAGPFVSVNCAALPTTLIESELFGYERGAFTGADRRKTGRIVSAQNGTIFLDEIGDLPMEAQGHLLRFLQDKTVTPLGSTTTIRVDVRVVAATNVELEEAIRAGRFREDLYYRLNGLTIRLPPLREREGDAELLAQYFLRRFAGDLGRRALRFHDSALDRIRRHTWPGNVRELISAIRRAVVVAEGRWIRTADLFGASGEPETRLTVPTLSKAREELERKLLHEALRLNASNVKRAASELGVSRVTFYRMLEKHAIKIAPDPE